MRYRLKLLCRMVGYVVGVAGVLVHPASGLDFHVATTGRDANPGTKAAPFLTLAKAQAAVRTALPTANEGITVQVHGGTYYLDQPLEFGPADSGSASAPVTYRGYADDTVVLSGARLLEPTWRTHSDDIRVADIGTGHSFDILFANGLQQVLARYPNYDADTVVLNGYAADAVSAARAARWENPPTGLVRALHGGRWGGQSYRITGLKPDGDPQLEWVGDNNRGSGMHKEFRMVENVFEELDAPGEWFYDQAQGTLYFYPPAGMDLPTATIEAASLEELIRVVGAADEKVKHLTFSHFTFTGTRRTLFTRKYEPLLRSDWCVARVGTMFLENAEHVTISDSRFDRVGGNAVFVSGYNRHHRITNNVFLENGATCVNIVGLPSAVRYPSFWDDHKFDIQDKTPGPLTEDYPKDILVSLNHMYNMGRFEKQTSGVNISMSESIVVSRNTVHGSPRAGLNICDGTWGGHLFEFNDLFDCVRETSDHGPWNSWGRDRFYSLLEYHHGGAFGTEKRPYAFLDAWKTTIIRNNRVHYDEPTSYGIDLDDGSSNYEIYNNLLLNTEIKLREGFDRKVYNNIIINKRAEFHVWYDECRDLFTRNIVINSNPYSTRHLKSSRAKAMEATFDHNVFYNGGADVTVGDRGWDAAGWDRNSVVSDPMFVDPEHLDYRVKPDSPALQIGFKNFPMDQFGKPGAPQPKPIVFVEAKGIVSDSEPLMGATIAGVTDMSIQSVLGSPDQTGVYFEAVPEGSYAAGQGFLKHDAIRVLDGRAVGSKRRFWRIYNALEPGAPVSVTLLRNQHEQPFTFTKPLSGGSVSNQDSPADRAPAVSGGRSK